MTNEEYQIGAKALDEARYAKDTEARDAIIYDLIVRHPCDEDVDALIHYHT